MISAYPGYYNSFCMNERIGKRNEDGREDRGERDAQEGGGTTVGTSANWIITECAAFVL